MANSARSLRKATNFLARRVNVAIHSWSRHARRHPWTTGCLFASAFLAIVCALGWTWTSWRWRSARFAFDLERLELRDAIEDARTIAFVESQHRLLAAVNETWDASGEKDAARRVVLDRVADDLRREIETAAQRPRGVLAAERVRLELARLVWRERHQPAEAERIYAASVERLTSVTVPSAQSEDRDRLLQAAFHGRFHAVLESYGGVELSTCLTAWAEHLEATLERHRGAPWVGHAWTRFAVAEGLLAESRATASDETAKRHYRAALASPPESIRHGDSQRRLPPHSIHRATWSVSWLPAPQPENGQPTVDASGRGPASGHHATVGAERLFFDEWLEDRGEAFARLARAEFLAGDFEAAVGLQRETVAARSELRTRAATRRRRWLHLRESFTLGVFLKAAGELSSSRSTLEATLNDALSLVDECPEWRAPRALCREARDALAIAYRAGGEESRALDLLLSATIALSALRLDREPLAALDDQAVIREELGEAHAAAGRKSLAWRNFVESLTLRDAIWRREPQDESSLAMLLQSAQTTWELAVTPAEWRESLNSVEPLLDRLDPDRVSVHESKAVQAALGQLHLMRGSALQTLNGDLEASEELVAHIRDSFSRARELLANAGTLPPERARDIDGRIRACEAVLKKLRKK